ncbi:MAG: ABC transporter ATP-binding protein, partial [Terriglobales bacterium]
VMSDVEGVRNLLGTGLIEFAGSSITSLIALALLLKINVAMALVAFGFVAAFSLTIQKSFGAIRPIFRERRVLNSQVTGRLTESIAGVRVVKGYRAEERESAVFAGGLDKLLRNVFRTLNATAAMDLSSKLLLGGVGALLWYMGAVRVLNGAITLGDLVAFNLYLALLVAPMIQIVSIGTQLSEAIAGLDRTHELLQLQPEDADPERTLALSDAIGAMGEIVFDEVSFAYNGGPEVLHQISFQAAPGTMTALVGPSGSGKSTIIGLVAAFYAPRTGAVRVGGRDLRRLKLDDYRARLGVVLQESFLFDGTIRENVLFARPGAGEEAFERAVRTARVDEFAERFEKGYETIVGERGVKLSGGQRQRLSIARAILADPAILILDDATSSLDSESEALIQQGLQYLLAGRTTFVIAHRLSTIRAADQILVIEDGRILERGKHEELLAREGRYYDLYTRQLGLDRDRFLAPGEGDAVPDAVKVEVPSAGGGDETVALNILTS